ncbi:unnamed protein product [Pneumocystis jirovecii]|uniref:Uncharacterized protein n=1 Tax=Pneumocystis jirovecii TaxID=42068 RepID=L0P9A9_PNEJI|nr:unnamed protein product [Pneumocystis jirovecii]
MLLLQIRSTRDMISESLECQLFRLKNQNNAKKPLWTSVVPLMSWTELIKERWNNSLRFTSLWIQNIDVIKNTNNLWSKIYGISSTLFFKLF